MNDKNYDPNLHEPLPEGEEAAPPLTHTMSIVRWVILAGISVFAFAMVLSFFGLAPWEARADDAAQYHCPMHPTYISDQPGDCPICGMSLVPIDKAGKEIKEEKKPEKIDEKEKASEKVTYSCPMHPGVTSDKPGECPKCGMDFVKVKAEDATYVCPMHPEVTSDKPGECPKCGMDLVKEKKDDKIEIKKAIDTKVAYYCPMHPINRADAPSARCSWSQPPAILQKLTIKIWMIQAHMAMIIRAIWERRRSPDWCLSPLSRSDCN